MTAHDESLEVSRTRRGEWKVVAPLYLLMGLAAMFNGGTCSRQDDVARDVRDLRERVARIEGALGVRVAHGTGAEGAGGTVTGQAD